MEPTRNGVAGNYDILCQIGESGEEIKKGRCEYDIEP
jgi:hypothetical protein